MFQMFQIIVLLLKTTHLYLLVLVPSKSRLVYYYLEFQIFFDDSKKIPKIFIEPLIKCYDMHPGIFLVALLNKKMFYFN